MVVEEEAVVVQEEAVVVEEEAVVVEEEAVGVEEEAVGVEEEAVVVEAVVLVLVVMRKPAAYSEQAPYALTWHTVSCVVPTSKLAVPTSGM